MGLTTTNTQILVDLILLAVELEERSQLAALYICRAQLMAPSGQGALLTVLSDLDLQSTGW